MVSTGTAPWWDGTVSITKALLVTDARVLLQDVSKRVAVGVRSPLMGWAVVA
ncbi:uncharacterized protein METZ01_LOCUS399051 [marine metagenome]|uniref:Uncharacterized protein n=1 Tax=marine metagenome TaxID=408172 RepID=A0A382VI69_9ZZZZ